MMNGKCEQDGITAIIVNFNAGELLKRCVTNLLQCRSVHRVIVIDNASTDASIALLPQHERLRIHRNASNVGFSGANNIGLKLADTNYVLLLNPDTMASPHAIEAMAQFMDQNSEAGMCGPLILNEDGSEQRGCRRDEPRPLAALGTLLGKREGGINKVGAPLPREPVAVDAISGACMFVRREALDDVGPLDEGYFLHCEDLDWCKRFWQKGWKVMFLPHVTITHTKGGSSRNRRVRVEWHKHKGMARYYGKFYRDRYPRIMLAAVYGAIWGRFVLLAPFWAIRSYLR